MAIAKTSLHCILKKRSDIEIWSIDSELNKEHFYGKSMQNMQQTLVLDLFLTLVKKKTLLEMTYFERKLSKNVKKMTWFFFYP